jgi:hypothetical protein
MLFKRREGGIHALQPSGGFVSPVTAAGQERRNTTGKGLGLMDLVPAVR